MTETKIKDTGWDEIYAQRMMTMWEPQQAIVQFSARFLQKRVRYADYEVKKEVNRILDLGCGNGSAVAFFARQGYQVDGVDISTAAVTIGRDFLEKEGLSAELKVGSCDSLPYANASFDCVVSFGVLDHVYPAVAAASIAEIRRVMSADGLLFLALCGSRSSLFGQGRRVDHHTYLLEEGFEAGQVQRYYDREDIDQLLKEFKIIDLRHWEEERIDPEAGAIKGKSARWFITAKPLDSAQGGDHE